VRAGLLARTPRGRVATEAAFRHLGHPVPRGGLILSGGTGDPPPDGASSQTLFDA
jgi:holliday junction DNA helicase RuvB